MSSLKKNKHLIKRRVDNADSNKIQRPTSPRFTSSSHSNMESQHNHLQPIVMSAQPAASSATINADSSSSDILDFSLQKILPRSTDIDIEQNNKVEDRIVEGDSAVNVLLADDKDSKGEQVEIAEDVPLVEDEEIRKRRHEEDGGKVDDSRDVMSKKKKNGMKMLAHIVSNKVDENALPKREVLASEPPSPPIGFSSMQLDWPQLLDDLKVLTVDFFYGHECNAAAVALYAFGYHRFLVYRKSSAIRSKNEPSGRIELRLSTEDSVVSPAPLSPNEQEESSVKSLKTALKPGDPTKASRKRTLSDRQKNLDRHKARPVKKKTDLAQKPLEEHLQKKQASKTATPSSSGLAKPAIKATTTMTEPVKKQEQIVLQPSVAQTPSPTHLVMKFPPRSTLPSVASLKAKLAKYGQLDHSATRVYWKTYTCKVLFKFKAHAQAALSDLKEKNDLFGQVKVDYYIREVETTDSSTDTSPKNNKGLELKSPNGAAGNSTVPLHPRQPLIPIPRPVPTGQLKSILKKPGDEVSGGTIAREAPRVKFLLASSKSRADSPPTLHPLVTNGRNNADGPSYYPRTTTTLSTTMKSVSPHPLLPPRPPLEPNANNDCFFSPPSFPPSKELHTRSLDLQPLSMHRVPNGFEGCSALQLEPPVDISDQMLSLLTRCSDIVTGLKTALGHVPYHLE